MQQILFIMKKFFFLAAISFSLVACPPQPKHVYDKIEYKSITRGLSEYILVERKNKKQVQLIYTKNNQEVTNRALDKKELQDIFDRLKYLDVNNIHQLDVPSKKHQYDGAMITTISITAQQKLFKSPSFDHDNPPKKLLPLIHYLKSLIK